MRSNIDLPIRTGDRCLEKRPDVKILNKEVGLGLAIAEKLETPKNAALDSI